jgi:hypothetical protein
MIIIDKDNLLSQELTDLIKDTANVPYRIEGFTCLEDLHIKEKIKVYIERKTDKIVLHEQTLDRLAKEIDFCKSEKRKVEIHRIRESISNVIRLGEYKPQEKSIYLYFDTIMAAGGKNCFLTTYIHEMMHAYYDRQGHEQYPYIYEIEEPLAEAGMLLFLNKTHNQILPWAKQNVKAKFPVLKDYAYGADLYEEWEIKHTDLEEKVEHYKNLYDYSRNGNYMFMKDRHKRDCFEDWLLGNGSSASSAAYNACYIPLLKILKNAVSYVTKGQTENLYDILSKKDLDAIRMYVAHSYIRSGPPIKYLKVIDQYIDYLIYTGQIKP